ncbi:hypothetical protein P5673_010995, partial [Acropora cervicornis]
AEFRYLKDAVNHCDLKHNFTPHAVEHFNWANRKCRHVFGKLYRRNRESTKSSSCRKQEPERTKSL